MNAVGDLLAQVAQLTDEERGEFLKKLQAQSVVLSGIAGPVASVEYPSEAGDMYFAMAQAAKEIRDVRIMHFGRFKDSRAWPDFVKAAEAAEKLVLKLVPKGRVEQQALRKYVANLIVTFLAKKGMDILPGTLVWGLENVDAVIDHHFPGYMKAGHLPVVVKALFAGTTRKLRISIKSTQ